MLRHAGSGGDILQHLERCGRNTCEQRYTLTQQENGCKCRRQETLWPWVLDCALEVVAQLGGEALFELQAAVVAAKSVGWLLEGIRMCTRWEESSDV